MQTYKSVYDISRKIVFSIKYLLLAKRRHQQKMVKESLTRALDEVAEAKRTGKKLMSFDDFLKEVSE